jgi:hypothetical protein
MKQPQEAGLLAALLAMSERERTARDRLIQARDELSDRDDRFAALEAELWTQFEQHERRTREEAVLHEREEARLREAVVLHEREEARLRDAVALHEREDASLREEIARLRLRLDQVSAPMRLYAGIKRLPMLRRIAARRIREWQATLRARMHG